MSEAAEVLVIILAIVLSVFLVVAIILGIYLIRLSAEIRRVAESAQKTVDHIEGTVAGFSRVVSPVFIAGIAERLLKKFTSSKKK